MDRVWFTSDPHFFHNGALKFRPRFKTIDDMNDTIVQNWNSVVEKGDRVYLLGDVSLGAPEETRDLLNKLKGQIFLVLGNHDRTAVHRAVKSRFVWIKDYFYLKVGDQKIALSHYAFRTWRNSHHGSWHLHGHSHGSLEDIPTMKSFDVGVDCWDFTPVSLEKVREVMTTKTFVPVDHHF